MNFYQKYWSKLGYSQTDIDDPRINIRAGIDLLKRIQRNMPKATVAEIGTIYNSLEAQFITNYGIRLERIYNEKPWKSE